MSVMERHNYSNCPIKKRPFYAEKLEGKAGNDDAPVDLSSTGSNYKFAYSNNEALDFSTRRLTPSKEEEHNFKHEIYPISNRECSENSTNWYRREPNADQYYDRKIIHNDQHHRIHRNESSISPIVTNSLDFREMYKNPYRNHNNNLIAGQGYYHNQPDHSGSEHMMMLSPASSQLSYGSNQSDFGESSEPEDLSVRNRKKVLVARDSSVNIQHPRNDYGEASSDLYYQCRSCSKCYSTYAGLVKHQQFHLAPSVHKSDEVEYKTITLSKSDLNARDKSGVENAKVVNPPRYQCKDCGKSYSTYSGLTKHQQFHCPAAEGNQVKKVFSCKNCDKVYVSLGALKMHIRTHTLPCKCPLCGKAFSRPWLLQGHIRTHTGEKPFSCQHCHRAFADRSNLRAHLQTHSEVKKYSCTSCTKTFSRMSLLVKHLQGGCPGSTSGSQSYGNGHNDHSVYDDASRAIEHNSDNGLIAYNANTGTRQDYSMDHLYQENVQVY